MAELPISIHINKCNYSNNSDNNNTDDNKDNDNYSNKINNKYTYIYMYTYTYRSPVSILKSKHPPESTKQNLPVWR